MGSNNISVLQQEICWEIAMKKGKLFSGIGRRLLIRE